MSRNTRKSASGLGRLPQRQDALDLQLHDLSTLATSQGLYDAAAFVTALLVADEVAVAGDSTITTELVELLSIAHEYGLYDAADLVLKRNRQLRGVQAPADLAAAMSAD